MLKEFLTRNAMSINKITSAGGCPFHLKFDGNDETIIFGVPDEEEIFRFTFGEFSEFIDELERFRDRLETKKL